MKKKRLQNRSVKSEIKTCIKKYMVAIEEKNKEKAEENFKIVASKMDNAVNKGVFHKNTVARKKSRMHRLLAKITA